MCLTPWCLVLMTQRLHRYQLTHNIALHTYDDMDDMALNFIYKIDITAFVCIKS